MKLNNRSNSGFTLIELLVVIAIIVILASVILAFLSGAKKKSIDSAIQSELASLKNQAGIFYASNTNSYDNFFTTNDQWSSADSNVNALLVSINKKTTVHTAGSSPAAWAAQAQLATDTTKYICIDSNLIMTTTGTAMTAGATVCP